MTTKIEQTPDPAILDLLNAPTGSLRVDDVYALQGYARALDAEVKRAAAEAQRQIDQRIADSHDAARMREIDALVSGGRLLDRERLQLRWQTMAESGDMRNVTDYGVELVTAFAAALLTDGAVRAAAQESYRERHAVSAGNFPRSIMAAAIRAAGVEPVERAGSVVTVPAAMYDAEKARADKAEAERDTLVSEIAAAVGSPFHAPEQLPGDVRALASGLEVVQKQLRKYEREIEIATSAFEKVTARADNAESTLADLETVIAETSHAAGISGTMTSAARVLEMGRAITQERNMSHDCQKDRNATLAKNRELNERATKAEGALVQMTKEADELRSTCEALRWAASAHRRASAKAYASREAYDASIKATIAAESACKALRAEVAALRGLANIHPSRGDVPAVKAALDAMRGKWGSSEGAVAAIAAALATVPPAKVADAAKPEPECTCAASGHFNLAEINACLRHGARAPKPEPAGLEPLGPPTVPGFPPMHYRGLVARINELSAIAKRGGS